MKNVLNVTLRENGKMFTIDLLKGQGIPVKSRPEGIAVAVVTVVVPIVIALVIFSFYLSNRIIMSIQKREIANYEAKIKTDKLSHALKMQRAFEEEEIAVNGSLSEVSSSIGKYTQWSSVLETLVMNMPDSMVLAKLAVKQRSVRKKMPKKDEPGKMVDVSVPVRTLQIKVCGTSHADYDREIRDFRDRLKFSNTLGPKLEDIIVSQGFDTLQGQYVVSYEIDCVFKPGL